MNRIADDFTSLRDLFAADQLILDPVELITYEIDAGVDRGHPGAVLFPADTQDVVRAVAWCRDHAVPLVARGSGTGLSGGAVSVKGGLVLEFSRMKQIEQVDEISLRARFQPGVIALSFADTVAAGGSIVLPTRRAPVRPLWAAPWPKTREVPTA